MVSPDKKTRGRESGVGLTFRRRCRDCFAMAFNAAMERLHRQPALVAVSALFTDPFGTGPIDNRIEHANVSAGARLANTAASRRPQRFEDGSGSGISPLLHHDMLSEASTKVRWDSEVAEQGGLPSQAASRSGERTDPRLFGFAMQDGSGEAYNEDAFQYFLEVERRRAELSNRPFLLMLIEFRKASSTADREIDVVTAAQLFSILSRCVRETDFIGWYREGRIVGAVLTQHGDADREQLSDVVRRRVSGALEGFFSLEQVLGLQARVYQLSSQANWRE
jgi:GGDEF domain-containing protein